MRWEALFRDLEGRVDEQARVELAGEVADRTRRELARLRLSDRLRAALRTTLVAGVAGAGQVAGTLVRSGPDWLMLETTDAGCSEVLVALDAILWMSGLPDRATEPDAVSVIDERWALAFVLRGLARDRAGVRLRSRDGSVLTGTIDRVGADFVELAEHSVDEPRRERDVRGIRVVPFTAIATITVV